MENRRLDASENEALIGMARMGADAFGYTRVRIDRHLAQLLRLRVSQAQLHLPQPALRGSAQWASPRRDRHPVGVVGDRASLRGRAGGAPLYRGAHPCRRHRPDAAFQRFHDALAENFSPEEILEIVGVVVNMNVWTRIKLAEGAMPGRA